MLHNRHIIVITHTGGHSIKVHVHVHIYYQMTGLLQLYQQLSRESLLVLKVWKQRRAKTIYLMNFRSTAARSFLLFSAVTSWVAGEKERDGQSCIFRLCSQAEKRDSGQVTFTVMEQTGLRLKMGKEARKFATQYVYITYYYSFSPLQHVTITLSHPLIMNVK